MLMSTSRFKRAATLLTLAASLALAAPIVEARPGSSGGMGSRGSKTYTAPSATPTAPGAAAPIQRTQTQPGPAMGNPGMNPAAAQRPRFGGGFMAGLLGAGLLGALLGSGFLGGLGGIASFIGLLLQVGLLVLIVTFAVRWFRRRQAGPAPAAYARDSAGSGMNPGGMNPGGMNPGGMNPGGLNAGGMSPRGPGMGAAPVAVGKVAIGPGDFESFELALNDVQEAYGREDVARLRTLATPEMAGYFEEELRANEQRGVVNRISGVKLNQGDLSEAWSEGQTEYATVAMRYAITDVTVDRRTNAVVETGEPEAVELWTFVRQRGGRWLVSAIQQGR
ncbi:MAG: TIM44-like domain-containing protein [Methylobacterium sp.]|uniref:TIM44-like domain-containing protein n=1 Tax=Methylobacterium sp. TaxID=409 RepID=UPI0025EA7F61|nr:TIM44-like domain-containing protein [Methylobacterium sp.]MBX9932519.1 TIM44-like domain-containing protein [Methylobacterium sp.]